MRRPEARVGHVDDSMGVQDVAKERALQGLLGPGAMLQRSGWAHKDAVSELHGIRHLEIKVPIDGCACGIGQREPLVMRFS